MRDSSNLVYGLIEQRFSFFEHRKIRRFSRRTKTIVVKLEIHGNKWYVNYVIHPICTLKSGLPTII